MTQADLLPGREGSSCRGKRETLPLQRDRTGRSDKSTLSPHCILFYTYDVQFVHIYYNYILFLCMMHAHIHVYEYILCNCMHDFDGIHRSIKLHAGRRKFHSDEREIVCSCPRIGMAKWLPTETFVIFCF